MQTWNKTLYCTHAPCYDCAEYMIENNVLECFFAIPYRLTDGVDALRDAGAKVYRVTPAGYVINQYNNEVVEMP
jgi:deoxycytidylate deaminase